MKVYTKPGSKERLLEMFQRVNKITLNENALGDDSMGGSNLRGVKVNLQNGDSFSTSMAAHLSDDDIKNYYAPGKTFNVGSGPNDNLQKVSNIEILREEGLEEAKPFVLGAGYTHFATDNETGKIVNGWDYKGYDQAELRQFKKDYFYNDLKDMGVDPKAMRIVTRHYLETNEGIDPSDTNNWFKDLPTNEVVYEEAEKTIDNIPNRIPCSNGLNINGKNIVHTPKDNIQKGTFEKQNNGREGGSVPCSNGLNVDESTDQERYENVVFAQGDDATEPLKILNNEGPEAALEYLKQWHYPGEHEGTNKLSQGSSDQTFEKDGYIMSWNAPIGYIGLQYDSQQGSEAPMNENDIDEPPTRSDDPNASDIMSNLSSKEPVDQIPGGLGDDAGDQKFSADQIRKGLKVEMEHTDDPIVAMDIVIDHLTEDENYYGDESQDPEQAAQCGAMKDANDGVRDGTNDGVKNPEDKEETDILLGFKPMNVGDTIKEYDNYNYPPGADADPRAPWHEKEQPEGHEDDEFEEDNPEPEGDVYRNRY